MLRFFFLLTGLSLLQIFGQSSDSPLPEMGVPESVGVQLKTHNFTVEILERLHAFGFRSVRRGLYWNSVEKKKGEYNFSGWDAQMAKADELGLTVVMALFGNNDLYKRPNATGGIVSAEERAGFAAFAAAAARQYQDQDVIWEIWNEPNVRTFWRKDGKHNTPEFAQEYTALVKAVMPAMLAADPDVFVAAGSVSNYWEPSYEWTESCFKLGMLETGIRAWSVHPYGVKTPEEFSIGHGRTRELLKQYGKPGFPMINTERGFAVKKTYDGWSGGSLGQALEYQGWHFVRQFMLDQLNGVPLTIWYEWDGEKFGLVEKESGTPRPAYADAKEMLVQLDGYRLQGRLETDSELDYLVVWRHPDGGRKLVAWTAPPAGFPPDEYMIHDLTLLITSGKGSVTDAEGNEVKFENGALVIPLTGEPAYLTIPPDMEFGRGMAGPSEGTPGQQRKNAARGETTELDLFTQEADWEFGRNNGQGSFELDTDGHGVKMGVLAYDFLGSEGGGGKYIFAKRDLKLEDGTTGMVVRARSTQPQRVTFRFFDKTNQKLQVRARIRGTGRWEEIELPLNRKLEHWGGANDGMIRFPTKNLMIIVPRPAPGSDMKGQVELSLFEAVFTP